MSAADTYQLTCEQARESLGAYALGVLDAGEVPALEAHLATCSGCRQALDQEQSTVDALAIAVQPVLPLG